MKLQSGVCAMCLLLMMPILFVAQNQSQKTPPERESQSWTTMPEAERKFYIALRGGELQEAQQLARDLVAANPADSWSWNAYGEVCAALKNYDSAIEAWKRSLELKPSSAYVWSQLMGMYARSGYTSELDSARKEVRKLFSQGRVEDDIQYRLDSFNVGEFRVDVDEIPILSNHASGYHFDRYLFEAFSGTGDRLTHVHLSLASTEHDQRLWASKHKTQAAAGERVFSLDYYDGHSPDPSGVYKYYDGEPSYEQVRQDVKQVLLGKLNRMPNDQWGRRPNPD